MLKDAQNKRRKSKDAHRHSSKLETLDAEMMKVSSRNESGGVTLAAGGALLATEQSAECYFCLFFFHVKRKLSSVLSVIENLY